MTEDMNATINMTSTEMLTAYTEWLDKQGHIVKGWGTDGRLEELASEFAKTITPTPDDDIIVSVWNWGDQQPTMRRRPTITPTETEKIPEFEFPGSTRRPAIIPIEIEEVPEFKFPSWPEDFGWERSASGEWGRTSTLDTPTRMGRLLCRLGYHKWENWKKATNLDDGLYYLMCKRCGAS